MSDDRSEQVPLPEPLSEQELEKKEALKALLINDEGDISDKLESALLRIFARFSTSYRTRHASLDALQSTTTLPVPKNSDVLSTSDLDDFALATNGSSFPEEAKEEIQEYLDTDDEGNLTYRGFCEMFHLQSDNDPEETWKDLKKCGFDDRLVFVGVKGPAGGKDKETEEAKQDKAADATGNRDEDDTGEK